MSHSVAVRVVSLSTLFIVTFIAGLIPLRLRKKRRPSDAGSAALRDMRRNQFISLSTCLAGGAFFASSMLELIPVVQKDFKYVLDHHNISAKFPLAEFGISVGFFMILIVEQIIHVFKEGGFAHGHGHSHIQKDSTSSPLLDHGQASAYGTGTPVVNDHHSPSNPESGESDNDVPTDRRLSAVAPEPSCHKSRAGHVQTIEDDFTTNESEPNIFLNVSKKHQNKRHYLRSYLLLIALSVHALFEGLAIGLFQSIDDMIQVLVALVIHKCILAFSIGINLVQHKFPVCMVAKSSFIFSVMSPVGFGIGILLLEKTARDLGKILSAVFQSIATGTFLYVTFFEIFFHELNSKECHKLLKVLMMILGYSVIAIVQYFEAVLKE